jgi:hypothetical protein
MGRLPMTALLRVIKHERCRRCVGALACRTIDWTQLIRRKMVRRLDTNFLGFNL